MLMPFMIHLETNLWKREKDGFFLSARYTTKVRVEGGGVEGGRGDPPDRHNETRKRGVDVQCICTSMRRKKDGRKMPLTSPVDVFPLPIPGISVSVDKLATAPVNRVDETRRATRESIISLSLLQGEATE